MKPTILIVDDDPDTRTLLTVAFESKDYQVMTASNGVEAIKRFEQRTPAVMLLDISMPRVNGLDLLHLLKEMELLSHTKVMMISGLGYREIVQQAIVSGATDFILKPFEFPDIISRVEKLISQDEMALLASEG